MNVIPRENPSAAAIESWISGRIAQFVNIEVEAVSSEKSFESFGIDSARAIDLVVELEECFQLPDELPLDLLFDAASIKEASNSIYQAICDMDADKKVFA